MLKPHRKHPLWFAHIVHRISGVTLALFLPFHFYVLALSLQQADKLDSFLVFAQLPLVKLAEFGLVFLLAVHMFGGLRLLALEWLPWSSRQKTFAAAATAGGMLLACCFLFNTL